MSLIERFQLSYQILFNSKNMKWKLNVAPRNLFYIETYIRHGIYIKMSSRCSSKYMP